MPFDNNNNDNKHHSSGTRFATPPAPDEYENEYEDAGDSAQPVHHGSSDSHGSGFVRLFIPSGHDSTGVKARKIAALAAIILLVGILIYFIITLAAGEKTPNDALSGDNELPASTTVITSETATAATTTTAPPETEPPVTTTPPPPPLVMRENDDIAYMYSLNNDTAGWLNIGGTAVNTVVVQGEDNDYYLNHDFYGNSRQAGFVYADFRCVINDYDFNQSDNITVYGHNQADGSMFGTLQYYKITKQNTSRFSFYQEHPTFTFSNLYEDYTYKIVAMFISESDASQSRDGIFFDPHNFVRFSSDPADKRSFESFVKNINERSEVLTGVDMQEGDKFMTLSTCSNEFDNSRFIVIGRRVRDGESPEVDTSAAVLNPNVKEPDLNYIYYGN